MKETRIQNILETERIRKLPDSVLVNQDQVLVDYTNKLIDYCNTIWERNSLFARPSQLYPVLVD